MIDNCLATSTAIETHTLETLMLLESYYFRESVPEKYFVPRISDMKKHMIIEEFHQTDYANFFRNLVEDENSFLYSGSSPYIRIIGIVLMVYNSIKSSYTKKFEEIDSFPDRDARYESFVYNMSSVVPFFELEQEVIELVVCEMDSAAYDICMEEYLSGSGKSFDMLEDEEREMILEESMEYCTGYGYGITSFDLCEQITEAIEFLGLPVSSNDTVGRWSTGHVPKPPEIFQGAQLDLFSTREPGEWTTIQDISEL